MSAPAPPTLFALASAPGRAGVAVLRVSGPRAGGVFTALCRPAGLPEARKASLRTLINPETSEPIDHALTLWFPAPHSFTGEAVAELHLHGGRAIVSAALAALTRLEDFAPAGAGEFSRRAFENGKMDLTEAEGLADLIDAETEAQRRQALRQMDGALGRLYQGWADILTQALAFNEAAIDFADEEGVPPDIAAQQSAGLATVREAIAAHLHDNHRGERLREGLAVAILGAPNAGKSSLLNALAQRDAAIVSPTAGTTRDAIEVHLDLGGYPVSLIDTAGLRNSSCAIESEGVARALARAASADLKILLFDGAAEEPFDAATLALADQNAVMVVNKGDVKSVQHSAFSIQGSGDGLFPNAECRMPDASLLVISAKTGEGIPSLLERLTEECARRYCPQAAPALTRARHRQFLTECESHIAAALAAQDSGAAAELAAEELRLAVRALGRITGRVDVEDLLDLIFSRFCIGK